MFRDATKWEVLTKAEAERNETLGWRPNTLYKMERAIYLKKHGNNITLNIFE